MKKNIFQNFKLEISYFKHMTYFFDTIYFLRKANKFSINQLNHLSKTNQNIVYLNFKKLALRNKDFNSILEKKILNKNQTIFLLDFKETTDEELLSFLICYYKNSKTQKNPLIILNKSKKIVKNKEIFKNLRLLKIGYYLVLKYGMYKKTVIKERFVPKSKNNNWYTAGFVTLNLFSFIFMAFFGSTTQYVQMSALLESMTYFMHNQPEFSRIHATLMEPHISEERLSNQTRSAYSTIQQKVHTFNSNGLVNSYFLPGSNKGIINFDAFLSDYEKETYFFKTKIMNQSVYSNEKRVLMERIDLEQYLIKDYPFHIPLNGADYVYYMASNVADYLIDISSEDDLSSYSDLIGKVMIISYQENEVIFEQKLSINNIFYTSDVPINKGGPLSENEYVNNYSGKDKGLGKYLINLIGDFGVSTSTTLHSYFGSVFCFDFFGQNKSLKMILDDCLADYLKQDFQINFYFEGQPIEKYGIFIDQINNYYKNGYLFGFIKYYLLVFSIVLFLGGLVLFLFQCRRTENEGDYNYLRTTLIIFAPFLIMQVFLLLLVGISNHSLFSISAMNIFGSGFSLVTTICFLAYYYFFNKKNNENVHEIKI